MPTLVFYGTEHFGAAMLSALAETNAYSIVGVITQPDRKVGRSQTVEKSPVKVVAEKYGFKIFEPTTLKNYEFPLPQPDVAVVCEYGLIIPKRLVGFPKLGTVNIHTSLLPKYRGASPIQTALLNGETKTGITLMQMDEKMDHGGILSQATIDIAPDDTYATLSEKMKPIAANLLTTDLPKYVAGSLTPQPQDEAGVTLCKLFTRDDGKIDFTKSAVQIYNQFRGLTPWPGIWTVWNGKRLKILALKPITEKHEPGLVVANNETIIIGTAAGAILITELQPEGKKPMSTSAFLAGNSAINGANLL